MSEFSDFIRNATPEEKERVYMDVMKKATERQQAMLRETETPMTYAELEMSAMLQERGWTKKDADEEARKALADAAVEDGYDGP
jgi:hypothetical protein